MERKQLQRLLIIIFGLAFIGSTGFAVIGSLFRRDNTTTTQHNYPTNAEVPSIDEQLQSQARGYAKVLEREPENTTALAGLYQISMQLGDLESAHTALKKLAELYPEDTQLANRLAILETQLTQQTQPATTETTPDTTEKPETTNTTDAPE